MWANPWILALLVWPAVVLIAALLNMLISWTFSWSELIFDYLIGLVIGITFYFGAQDDASWLEHFFLTVSLGLFGLLKWIGVSVFADSQTLFWWSAGAVVIATIVTALLDRASLAIGSSMKLGNGLLSIPIFLLKAPFALITSTVGILLGLFGMIYGAVTAKPGFGFLGGACFFEWGAPGTYATTFGCMVNVWKGNLSSLAGHELYHTRQFIYMHDWLGVFYFTLAGIWGILSALIAGVPFHIEYYWTSHPTREIGNPIECAAYHGYP